MEKSIKKEKRIWIDVDDLDDRIRSLFKSLQDGEFKDYDFKIESISTNIMEKTISAMKDVKDCPDLIVSNNSMNRGVTMIAPGAFERINPLSYIEKNNDICATFESNINETPVLSLPENLLFVLSSSLLSIGEGRLGMLVRNENTVALNTASLISISVTGGPDINTYSPGERISIAGLVVELRLSTETRTLVGGRDSISFSPRVAAFRADFFTQDITVSYTLGGITRTCTFQIYRKAGRIKGRSFYEVPIGKHGLAKIAKDSGRLSLVSPILEMTNLFHPISLSIIYKTWSNDNTPYGKGCTLSIDREILEIGERYIMKEPDGEEYGLVMESGIPYDPKSGSWLTFSVDRTGRLNLPNRDLEVYRPFSDNKWLLTGIHKYPSTPENPDMARCLIISRNADGTVNSITYGKDFNGISGTVTFEYDSSSRINCLRHSLSSNQALSSFQFLGDRLKRITKIDYSIGFSSTTEFNTDGTDEIVSILDPTCQDEIGNSIEYVFSGNNDLRCTSFFNRKGPATWNEAIFNRTINLSPAVSFHDIINSFDVENELQRECTQLNSLDECGKYILYKNPDSHEEPGEIQTGLGISSNSLDCLLFERTFGERCFVKDSLDDEGNTSWVGGAVSTDSFINTGWSIVGSEMRKTIALMPDFLGMEGQFFFSLWIMASCDAFISWRYAYESEESFQHQFVIRTGFGQFQFLAVPIIAPTDLVPIVVSVKSSEDVSISDFRLWRYPKSDVPFESVSFDSSKRPSSYIVSDPIFKTLTKKQIFYNYYGPVSSTIDYISEPLNPPVWERTSTEETTYVSGLPTSIKNYGASINDGYFIEKMHYENGVIDEKEDACGASFGITGNDDSVTETEFGISGTQNFSMTSNFSKTGVATSVSSGNSSNSICYDNHGNVTSYSSGLTNYSFEYDSLGNVLSFSIGSSQIMSVDYWEDRLPIGVSYSNGDSDAFQCDENDVLTSLTTNQTEYFFTREYGDLFSKIESTGITYESDLRPSQNYVNVNKVFYEDEEILCVKKLPSGIDWKVQEFTYSIFGRSAIREKLKLTSDNRGRLTSISHNTNGLKQEIVYDALNRTSSREIKYGNRQLLNISYSYKNLENGRTTPLVSEESSLSLGYAIDTFRYEYNESGTLKMISDYNGPLWTFTYDDRKRLVSEMNERENIITTRTYDDNGNVLTIGSFSFNTWSVIRSDVFNYDTIVPGYGHNVGWHDQIKTINGIPVRYDAIGNIIEINNKYIVWSGRKTMSINGIQMEYDHLGRRVKKGNKLILWDGNFPKMEINESLSESSIVHYYIDESGVSGFKVSGIDYAFRRNCFGDVISIMRSDGVLMCRYSYDAWGNCKAYGPLGNQISPDADHIANKNPFRWRGYYYDAETNLYYLFSRYYDPEIGRFISPDSVDYLDPTTINGLNLYAYCNNEPVNYCDPSGHFGIALTLLIATGVGLAIGFGVEVVKQASDGATFWDVTTWNWDASTWNWWEIGKSSLLGAANGFAYGLGGVAGGILKGSFQALTIAKRTFSVSQSIGLLLGIASAANFTAGIVGYGLHTVGTESETFNIFKGVSEGLGQAGKGVLSFFTAGMFVGSGYWKVGIGAKNSFSSIIGRAVGRYVTNFFPNYMLDILF